MSISKCVRCLKHTVLSHGVLCARCIDAQAVLKAQKERERADAAEAEAMDKWRLFREQHP